MAGPPAAAQPPSQSWIRSWPVTLATAFLIGAAVAAVAAAYFSPAIATAAGVAVALLNLVVAALATPLLPLVRAAFQPGRLVVVAVLLVIGGFGHAWFFGKPAPAEPKRTPTACDEVRSVAQASVSHRGKEVALLELLYSRPCHLYWAQVTPTAPLGASSLDVVVGVKQGERTFGQTAGKVSATQVVASDPVRDGGSCFAATVQVDTGADRFTLATDCV